jgi:polyisoprenyl-phosphate glycosyltransferase
MVMYFNPLKALMPVALWLIAVGVGEAVFDVTVHPVRVATNTILVFLSGLIIGSLVLFADLIVRSRPDA